MGQISTVKNILIIRLSSLGDILLTTPVIRSIKVKYPDSSLYFLVKPEYFDAIRYNPALAKIVEYDSENIPRIIEELKSLNLDLVYDLHNNFRSRKVVKTLGIRTEKYVKPSLKKFLLTRLGINLYNGVKSIPEMYVEHLNGITLDEKGLDFFLPAGVESTLPDEDKIIGLIPGAKHFTKRWFPEYYINLGNMLTSLGYKIAVLGGTDDKNICDEIARAVQGAINPEHKNDLLKIAADLKKCKLMFCNDSGLMHLATALKIPVMTFFGSSVREFGFAPYKSTNLILENNSLSCRPCSHIGKNNCPKKHFDCMRTLTPEYAFKEFEKLFERI